MDPMVKRWMYLALLAATLCAPPPGLAAKEKRVVGWVERVHVYPGGITLKAKMDSGAKTSSLNVTRLERFSRNGRPWVRFEVATDNGKIIGMERPEVRVSRVKRHGAPARMQPVVTIGLCLDSVYKQTEVSLTDRTGFLYQLLVGRRFMKGNFLIDPGRTLIAPATCKRHP